MNPATVDSVLRRIWAVGMDSSQVYPLAQVLIDSIGPRLTGTPQAAAAIEWLRGRYRAWDIRAHAHEYGTWQGWDRGVAHVDLLVPRVRTLEATLRPWSPGTGGIAVDGEVVLAPPLGSTETEVAAWLASARGKYVLLSPLPPTCRPKDDWERWALPGSTPYRPGPARMNFANDLPRLEAAGVAGLIEDRWSGGWGLKQAWASGGVAVKQGTTVTSPSTLVRRVPVIGLSCEDYGLLARLAESRQGPRLRVNARAELRPPAPLRSVVAELPGTERREEYVVLSAHLDSWDEGTGALDNGTGTVMMLEAMRILRAVHPRPKRTIVAGHWTGEEQGTPPAVTVPARILTGLYASFSQDNGTGRVARLVRLGAASDAYVTRWLQQLPAELTREIEPIPAPRDGASAVPNAVGSRRTDAGDPVRIIFKSVPWSYHYLYHSNRDTFDKISVDDVKRNATFVAMLAYLASEESRSPGSPIVGPRSPRP